MTQAARRRRVLIVEDEPALRLSYDRAFRPRYDLAFATNGAEAMEQLEQHRPDVAVLDVNLAGEPAYPVARRLAAAAVPFMFATGYGASGVHPEWADRPVIQKPFESEMLAAALASALCSGKVTQ